MQKVNILVKSNIDTLFLILEQNIVMSYIFLEQYCYFIFTVCFSVLINKNEVIMITFFYF